MVREREEWGMGAGGKETAAGDGRGQEAPKVPHTHVFHHGPPWTKVHPEIRPTPTFNEFSLGLAADLRNIDFDGFLSSVAPWGFDGRRNAPTWS